jgi:hypothetical protein
MEKLLTDYLYEYKNCPLPSLGSLVMQPGHAKNLPGESKMLPPIPFIELAEKEINHDSLVDFIAGNKKISTEEATALLYRFCNRVKKLEAFEELPLATAGSFYMDVNGRLHFKSVSLPAAFFPEATAERVIHPDVAHSVLVGDKETNSTVMTEMLQVEDISKSKWWIAALVLGLLALIIFFVNYSQNNSSNWGNARPVVPAKESKSYNTTDK